MTHSTLREGGCKAVWVWAWVVKGVRERESEGLKWRPREVKRKFAVGSRNLRGIVCSLFQKNVGRLWRD